ncbi:envelope stress response membrane protein PspC [Cerasicoccus arenae]|uniref:Phage shock protein C n=1 Tax=Cerasicoccus arenae TaxID=424488 RepID=A0A8J3DG80_9BACT|nr:envelope stress response membrane protein PspC [Cerasicoccus arenae]MBK1859622.1 envelope stress response membrane protein PspC [Cerasicoccus arenae]GHB96319.1 phage shock protein C [Cerasicoccus arenae]
MKPPSLPLYRSRNGWLLGVCQGMADWRQVPVLWVRLAVFITIMLTGFWLGLAIYVIVGLLLKPAPVLPTSNDEEQEFYASISTSRRQALGRLQRTFEQLDRRTRRLEHAVTSSEYDWQRRLNSGK